MYIKMKYFLGEDSVFIHYLFYIIVCHHLKSIIDPSSIYPLHLDSLLSLSPLTPVKSLYLANHRLQSSPRIFWPLGPLTTTRTHTHTSYRLYILYIVWTWPTTSYIITIRFKHTIHTSICPHHIATLIYPPPLITSIRMYVLLLYSILWVVWLYMYAYIYTLQRYRYIIRWGVLTVSVVV